MIRYREIVSFPRFYREAERRIDGRIEGTRWRDYANREQMIGRGDDGWGEVAGDIGSELMI
jgi:hypothetical protein